MRLFSLSALSLLLLFLCSCGGTSSYGRLGTPNMPGPTPEERQAAITAEASGDYFVGRRYHVQKTRFWGYVRKPGHPATRSKLVIINESQKRTPDRLPEDGPEGQRFGFDQNYEYHLYGHYNGRTAYDPNSNQILPEFTLTGYKLVNSNPGWLFSPDDHYDPYRFTLLP
jgi:hypothetical protein